jgi:hypothetical protein
MYVRVYVNAGSDRCEEIGCARAACGYYIYLEAWSANATVLPFRVFLASWTFMRCEHQGWLDESVAMYRWYMIACSY